MREKLNPEKSKNLRPLRVVLAILTAILIILILDRLPTSVKDRPTSQDSSIRKTTSGEAAPEGYSYFYIYGLLDRLEVQTEEKLKSLGVPEEEYENAAEYLSKEEILELEAATELVLKIENIYILADDAGINELMKIFNISDSQFFEKYRRPSITPTEYRDLTDMLTNYHKALDNTEDYDNSVD